MSKQANNELGDQIAILSGFACGPGGEWWDQRTGDCCPSHPIPDPAAYIKAMRDMCEAVVELEDACLAFHGHDPSLESWNRIGPAKQKCEEAVAAYRALRTLTESEERNAEG